MSETPDQRQSRPDKTFLSSFMLVIGVFSVILSVFAFFSGGSGFMAGLFGLAIAGIFFALGRTLDYLQEIRQRLSHLEDQNERKSEK